MSDEDTGVVQLTSKEGKSHEVPIKIAKMSGLVATTIDDDDDDDDDDNKKIKEVPINNVSDVVLKKVIDYCTHFTEKEEMTQIQTPLKSNKVEDLVQEWYAKFVDVDQAILFELVTAANFMDVKPLLDLTCLAVSIHIKGKSEAQLREIFNISEDFSMDEEPQVREETLWNEHQEGARAAAAAAANNNNNNGESKEETKEESKSN